ncbi:MAG TPA: sugar phosphate isomerase/epimerase [Granulicella sp.]
MDERRIRRSRREFLRASSVVAAAALIAPGRLLHASPLGLPVGLQLFSVREMLAKDFAGTLKLVASFGYQEVEAAGFYDHSPEDVKAALKAAGLRCPSAHYPFQQMSTQTDQILSFGKAIGLEYIVCSTPGFKNPDRVKDIPPRDRQNAYLLEDWQWSAEQFNQFGEKAWAAGMKFAYHNHTNELKPTVEGKVPLEVMIEATDPAKVSFEMDAGWVMMGGGDPVALLKKYPKRFCMLHVKDFKGNKPDANGRPAEATELGKGVMDNQAVFKAASKAYIKHIFVEQEGYDMPVNDSLKMDAEFMKKQS